MKFTNVIDIVTGEVVTGEAGHDYVVGNQGFAVSKSPSWLGMSREDDVTEGARALRLELIEELRTQALEQGLKGKAATKAAWAQYQAIVEAELIRQMNGLKTPKARLALKEQVNNTAATNIFVADEVLYAGARRPRRK